MGHGLTWLLQATAIVILAFLMATPVIPQVVPACKDQGIVEQHAYQRIETGMQQCQVGGDNWTCPMEVIYHMQVMQCGPLGGKQGVNCVEDTALNPVTCVVGSVVCGNTIHTCSEQGFRPLETYMTFKEVMCED